jgi:hypothetical protein
MWCRCLLPTAKDQRIWGNAPRPRCRGMYLYLDLELRRRRGYGGRTEEPAPVPVPVGVTGHRAQRPRGQVVDPPGGPHPAQPSSPMGPGDERWPIFTNLLKYLLKALRAPGGPIPQYKILYYWIIYWPIFRPLAPMIAQLVRCLPARAATHYMYLRAFWL